MYKQEKYVYKLIYSFWPIQLLNERELHLQSMFIFDPPNRNCRDTLHITKYSHIVSDILLLCLNFSRNSQLFLLHA